jgi:chromosome segregation ATPase
MDMKRKNLRPLTGFASKARSGVSQRRSVVVTNLAGLTHQLALARCAAAAAAAKHQDDLRTVAKAFQDLLAENVDLKARSEAAAQLANERLFFLQAELEESDARAEKLQVERDEFERRAREAREASAKLAGQLLAAKSQYSDLLARIGPSPAKSPSRPPVPPARVPLVPRVITTPRGAKKKAGPP